MTSYKFGDIRSACASGTNVTKMLSKLNDGVDPHVVLNYLYDHKNMPEVRWWCAQGYRLGKPCLFVLMPQPFMYRDLKYVTPQFQVADRIVKFGRINNTQFAFRDAWYPLRVRLLKEVDDGFRFKDDVQVAVDKKCYSDMRFIRDKMENDKGFFLDTRVSRAATERDIMNSRLLRAIVADNPSDIPEFIYSYHEREFVNNLLYGTHFQKRLES